MLFFFVFKGCVGHRFLFLAWYIQICQLKCTAVKDIDTRYKQEYIWQNVGSSQIMEKFKKVLQTSWLIQI